MIELFWTIIGIPTGYVTSVFINDSYNIIYNTTIPKSFKYGTITMVTLFSYLRGYTGNDLVTNISNISNIFNNTIEYQC